MEMNNDNNLNPAASLADEDVEQIPFYRRKRFIIPLLLLVIIAVISIIYWYLNMRNYVATDDAYIDANQVSISSKVLGLIKLLTVGEEDTVSKNQVLVQLDDADLQAQLELAKAGLIFAQEKIPLAQVNLNRAKDDYQRAELQFNKGVFTQEQFDHAKKALESAQVEFNIAKAQVGVSQAQVAVVETQLRNMQIMMPFAGVIAKRWVMAGEVVQPGQPIFSVYDMNHLWVTANLEETKVGSVKLDDHVDINVDAYPDYKFAGKVVDIGDYTASEFSLIPPNNASGNFTKVTQRVPIKISLINRKKEDIEAFPLRPGMSVEIKIKVK